MALGRITIAALGGMLVTLLVFLTARATNSNKDVIFSGEALLGKQIWLTHQCQTCHAIYGLGGHMGPDLTNVTERRGEDYIRWIITAGKDKMPSFLFSANEINGLLAYFDVLQQSGVYPLPGLWHNAYGQHPNNKSKTLDER